MLEYANSHATIYIFFLNMVTYFLKAHIIKTRLLKCQHKYIFKQCKCKDIFSNKHALLKKTKNKFFAYLWNG